MTRPPLITSGNVTEGYCYTNTNHHLDWQVRVQRADGYDEMMDLADTNGVYLLLDTR